MDKSNSTPVIIYRLPLLAIGLLTMVLGIWTGLMRVGWTLPLFQQNLILLHGPLMICGFLGTVIGMERAVASKYGWSFLAPVLTVVAVLTMVVNVPIKTPQILFTVGSLVLTIHFFLVMKEFPSLHLGIMTAGAVAWLIGNIFWLTGFPIPNVVLWWAGFLVMTIAGERLELSRILQPSNNAKFFFLLYHLIFVVGLFMATFAFFIGIRFAALAMLLIAFWLIRHDLAWKSVKQGGLTRFIAIALILGFFWLAIGGVLGLFFGDMQVGPFYDAILHAVFLGFVFSMIFGHAPIIFPAILNIQMKYGSRFYIHLALLHLSLVVRIVADLSGWIEGRRWGSMVNGIAIVLFILNTVTSIRKKQV